MINHELLDVHGKDIMKDLRFDKTDKMQYKDEGNIQTDRKLVDSVIECLVAASSEMNDNLYMKI